MKELICMTHGHELRSGAGGMLVAGGSAGQKRIKKRKLWDNFKSIINKIYFK